MMREAGEREGGQRRCSMRCLRTLIIAGDQDEAAKGPRRNVHMTAAADKQGMKMRR